MLYQDPGDGSWHVNVLWDLDATGLRWCAVTRESVQEVLEEWSTLRLT